MCLNHTHGKVLNVGGTELYSNKFGVIPMKQVQNKCKKSNVGNLHSWIYEIYNFRYYTEIAEVNFSAFVYRLFHEDFSSLVGTFRYYK